MRRTGPRPRTFVVYALALALLASVSAGPAALGHAPVSADPVASEIARWLTILTTDARTDEIWLQVKQAAQPELERADQAIRDGRRTFALDRLAAVQANLTAAFYVSNRPRAQRNDLSAFESEWRRLKTTIGSAPDAASAASLASIQPAAVRALAEIAQSQARVFYDASIEYGRNTTSESGFFYLDAARAQQEFVAFCRSLSTARAPSTARRASPAGPSRSLAPELDEVEHRLLAAYRPPDSISRHTEFIVASGTLKEARELDAAGMFDAALLRYLQASLRVALLRSAAAPPDAQAIAARIREAQTRLAGVADPSLGQLFVERAMADLARSPDAGSLSAAEAASVEVLPRYFAALAPAPQRPTRPEPRVTVTLVRWPFT
jgi:hypothetical protein